MFYFRYVDLCNKINKSPSAVAEELGFKRSSVTRWANNSVPRQATLQKSPIISASPSSISRARKQKDPATNGEVSPEKQELLDLIDSLSDDQCGKLSNIIKEAINLL